MERRTKLLIVIIVALALLIFGIWFLFQNGQESNAPQPPALPTSATPTSVVPEAPTFRPVAPESTPVPPDLRHIEDLAGIVVARIGSGTSAEGFRGYADVLINATPRFQTTLKQQRETMQKLHPATGSLFEILTRVVSIDGKTAVSGAETVTFDVSVQQAEYTNNATQPTALTYKIASVTFRKQADATYLVDAIVWKDIAP